MLRRWLRFNLVGILGIGIQMISLFLLKTVTGLEYLPATILAVEAALIHNFIWHERWTWKRQLVSGFARTLAGRFMRFHLTSGLISVAGNLLLMRLFVGTLNIPYLLANLLAITGCSLFNFLAADLFVFRFEAIPSQKKSSQGTAG